MFELPASLIVRQPEPADAHGWIAFLAREQARAYTGLVPSDFELRELEHWDPAPVAASFRHPGAEHRLIAELNGEIVAVAASGVGPASWEMAMGLVPALASRQLSRLYVAPKLHGTGVASHLFNAVVDDRPHYLWLIAGNERAAAFYRRRGFVNVDESVPAGGGWGGVPMHRMLRGRVGPNRI